MRANRSEEPMSGANSMIRGHFQKCPDCAELVYAEARICRFNFGAGTRLLLAN